MARQPPNLVKDIITDLRNSENPKPNKLKKPMPRQRTTVTAKNLETGWKKRSDYMHVNNNVNDCVLLIRNHGGQKSETTCFNCLKKNPVNPELYIQQKFPLGIKAK